MLLLGQDLVPTAIGHISPQSVRFAVLLVFAGTNDDSRDPICQIHFSNSRIRHNRYGSRCDLPEVSRLLDDGEAQAV